MSPDRREPLIDHTAYGFQIALSDAISCYVQELRRTQFRALTYRGADFGRAIATELYFRLVNDGQLRSAYARHMADESVPQDADAIPMSTVAYWIFRQVLRRPPALHRHRLKNYLKLTYALGAKHLEKMRAGASRTGPVIILALSRRFYDYLLPLRRALATDVIWLIPANSDWTERPESDGEKFIHFDTDTARQPIAPMPQPLSEYWHELPARYDAFRNILERAQPSAVVVTEGNQTSDEVLARAAQSLGVRSICIQQGWSPIVHAGFRAMRYSAFCVWGQAFADLLQPQSPQQRFCVTGSYQIGPASPPPRQAVSFFLQNNSLLITARAWDEMLAFILWTARTWPERDILVREHPASPLTDAEKALFAKTPNIRLCPAASASLRDVLLRTGIAVAFYSTTLLEALAVGAIPLIVNITGAPHYSPDLAGLGVGLEVQDFDAARQAMSCLLSGGDDFFRQRATLLAPRFFACSTGTALQNISAIIKAHQ